MHSLPKFVFSGSIWIIITRSSCETWQYIIQWASVFDQEISTDFDFQLNNTFLLSLMFILENCELVTEILCVSRDGFMKWSPHMTMCF